MNQMVIATAHMKFNLRVGLAPLTLCYFIKWFVVKAYLDIASV